MTVVATPAASTADAGSVSGARSVRRGVRARVPRDLAARAPRARQRWRRALLIVSFVVFPLTMNYLSPYLVLAASYEGIVNASLIAFATMLVGSLVLGRLWCGWACPMAGPQEFARPVNGRRPGRWASRAKWIIWVPWMVLIAIGALSAGGYRAVDLLYGTEHGISVAGSPDRPIVYAYVVYFLVIALFLGLAMALGRRGGCHAVCWMAPFMIVGRRLSNIANTPAVRLRADTSRCVACGTCTASCPMGLPVQSMVAQGSMEHSECVLCCTCADACPQRTIALTFGRAPRPPAAARTPEA